MRIVDLFSGAGGAAMGLHRAFPDADITGVDNRPMPRYPFRHVVADAMTYPLDGFDLVWASPPCQQYSRMRHIKGRDMSVYPMLVDALRTRLERAGVPWIIENVPGTTFRSGVTLCGLMFGLRVFRHRSFESSALLFAPDHPRHVERIRESVGARSLAYYTRDVGDMTTVAGHMFSLAAGSAAMGIDWMRKDELAEAIPPAYSTYLGLQLRAYLRDDGGHDDSSRAHKCDIAACPGRKTDSPPRTGGLVGSGFSAHSPLLACAESGASSPQSGRHLDATD